MVQSSIEPDALPSVVEESPETEAKWSDIFASLAKLQSGLHKAQADLGQLRGEFDVFLKSLDATGDEGGRR